MTFKKIEESDQKCTLLRVILSEKQKNSHPFGHGIQTSIIIVPITWKMGKNFVFGCVLRFYFLFSTQNQVPQIIIGLDGEIYHIKTLLVVIRTTFENFRKTVPVSIKSGLKFLISFYFRANKMSIQAYNSLFMLILINFRAILRVKNFKSKISSKIFKSFEIF